MFSRVIYGARVSLLVAFVSTSMTTVFGVFCGLFAGYYRGWVDTLVSRTVDAWLAIPYLLLAIGLASACSFGNGCVGGLIKPGVPVVIAVIALTSWTYPARIIRGQVLSLREKEFVDAVAFARRVELPDHRQGAVAQPHCADHRVRLDVPADRDPVRGGAVVPRASGFSRRRRAGAR